MGGMAQALEDDTALEARSAALHDVESLVLCLVKQSDVAAGPTLTPRPFRVLTCPMYSLGGSEMQR